MLAQNLPPGAGLWAAMDSPAAWTSEAYLAAKTFDAVQMGNWQRSGGRGEKPPPLPRPGVKPDKKANKKAFAEKRAAAFAARQRAKE